MGYATPSDPLLRFALYSGLAVFLLTLALLATIAVLRYLLNRRERYERTLSSRWQPVFFHAIEGLPYTLPTVGERDRRTVLTLWLHFTETLRGEARQRLRKLALDAGLDHAAAALLASGSVRYRLLGIVTLGRIGATESVSQLSALAGDANSVLSLLAARSLLQIDPAHSLPALLRSLPQRNDWPRAKVAAMIGEISAEILAPALFLALAASTPRDAAHLLNLIETSHLGDTWSVLERLLSVEQPPDVLAAALKASRDPRALPAARQLAAHDQWVVRAQAATALGRFGTEEDRLRLQAMLSDPEWWVRYRAARALTALPFVSRQKLEDLRAQLTDRFAANILAQALAETAPGAGA